MMSFLAELKRRKVVRVAVVYAATAFVVLQAADLILPRLGVPDWAMSLIVVLLLLGFPVALVLAWAFDLTPGGVVRSTASDDGVRRDVAQHAWIGTRTALAVAVLLVFGGGLGAGWFLRPGVAAAGDAGPTTVAVLPFSNLSGDAATDPFVDGVHDDLLTQLSRLGALRVISRTSVMEYRNSPKNIRVIAGELGAHAVLEGGVQRSGNRVRLNVQLIDARTDAHLWAETYERALTAENVFTIQSEIAHSIAQALQVELAPSDRAALSRPGTSSLEALELYYAGRQALRGNISLLNSTAPRLFERAVEIDPSFHEAWAGLVQARSWLVRSQYGTNRHSDFVPDSTAALAALQRAQSLAPRSASTRLAEAYYHYWARADLPRARELLRALAVDAPGDEEVLVALAAVERRLGLMDDALGNLREAARLDPRNPQVHLELGWTLAFNRDPASAVPVLERARILGPDYSQTETTLFGVLLWELGDTAAARRVAAESPFAARPEGTSWGAELALVARAWGEATAQASAAPGVRPVFFGYGIHYSIGAPLLAKIAWLAGDTAGVTRWTAVMLATADTLATELDTFGIDDRWGARTEPPLLRALAWAFRGDSAGALAAAREAATFAHVSPDVITGTAVLDHLVVVDIVTGRHDQAMDGIERLLNTPSLMKPARLRLDPIYDPLRQYPRFRALAEGRT